MGYYDASICVFWLINTVLWYMNIFELINIESFDYNKYMHNIYYRINLYPPLKRSFYVYTQFNKSDFAT